jgi:hypothetical protein
MLAKMKALPVIAAALLAGCTQCPYSEVGHIKLAEGVPRERVVEVLSDALKPMNYETYPCNEIARKFCDFEFARQRKGWFELDHDRFSLLYADMSLNLINYSRRQTPEDRLLSATVTKALQVNLDADFAMVPRKTSYGCVFGP